MNTLFKLITSHKKISIIVGILFLAIAIPASYTANSVYQNMQKMTAAPETTTYFPEYPALDTTKKNFKAIKHGEYLVKAGDCIACHTNTCLKEQSKPFAGGLAMQTPFGTLYTTNITPDKETGIGNWSEEQFITAMHKGISPKGHYYYPAFPYLYFSKVSVEDLRDIKAYLDSIPPVHQQNRKNEMVFPFNYRIFQLGWRVMFFHPSQVPFKDNPHQSALWNVGAHLTEGLGHCAMCHTPSYNLGSESIPLGAPIQKYQLTGAKVQGFLAPDITKRNLANIPEKEVVDVFVQDKLIGGGKIEGPMLEVNHDSLRYLSHEDLLAVATYLKSVQSQTPPRPTGSKLGKALYGEYCSGCHTCGAGGAPKYGDAADWDPILKKGLDKVYANAITGIGGMPAKGTCLSCSNDDIKQAVAYMLLSVQGKAVVNIPKQKRLTFNDCKRVYQENCSVCHNSGFKKAPKPGDVKAWAPIIEQGFLQTYENILKGNNGHPVHGACPSCSKAELIAALQYMMQTSTTNKDYSLW